MIQYHATQYHYTALFILESAFLYIAAALCRGRLGCCSSKLDKGAILHVSPAIVHCAPKTHCRWRGKKTGALVILSSEVTLLMVEEPVEVLVCGLFTFTVHLII